MFRKTLGLLMVVTLCLSVLWGAAEEGSVGELLDMVKKVAEDNREEAEEKGLEEKKYLHQMIHPKASHRHYQRHPHIFLHHK